MKFGRYLKLLLRHESAAIAAMFREQKLVMSLALILSIAGLIWLDPFPPNQLNIASGRPGGNYAQTIDTMNAGFREAGIRAHNIYTMGSIDNARLLKEPNSGVNAALIQGGAIGHSSTSGLVSLGSLAYEPLWIFFNSNRITAIEDFDELIRWRVGVGPEGGGTHPVLADALALNNLSIKNSGRFINGSYDENLHEFEQGQLDVVVMVANIQDVNIQRLFKMPNARLAQIRHVEAYTKHLRYLEVVTLPAESIDIARNIPTQEIKLLATTTQMVVNEDLHPDLQMLMLITIKDVLRQRQNNLFFAAPGKFPDYIDTSIPESPVAKRFYDYGTPIVWRYLPSWLAGIVDRLWILFLGAFAVLYPLSKIRLRLRCARFELAQLDRYERILAVERQLHLVQNRAQKMALLNEIESINQSALMTQVPVGMEPQYFQLLNALDLLRRKVLRTHPQPRGGEPDLDPPGMA
jgi:TRAP-type uncharacterized transport system substrate-binding protein